MGKKHKKPRKSSGLDAEPQAPSAPAKASGYGKTMAAAAALGIGLILLVRMGGKPAPTDASQAATPSGTSAVAPDSSPAVQPFHLVPEQDAFAGYAGSESCRRCHASAYDHWKDSHHGLAERSLRPGMDDPAFELSKPFPHGKQTSVARKTNDVYQVVTLGLDGKQPFPVDRVIGEDPLRQFLVDAPGGRKQVLEVAWDPHQEEWFNVYGDEDRQPGEWGHWTGRGMTWNVMCAACHNTRVRKNYDPQSDTYRTAMAEMTVSCEACHGPMKDHVDWQEAYPPSGAEGDPTLAAKAFSRDQTFDTCGTCHSRRGELTGDFVSGQDYWDHYSLAIPDDTDLWYPDGQVRDEDYEMTSFLSSKMHHAGVRCIDCHQQHSMELRLPGNQMCLACHNGQVENAPKIETTAHTFHQADSTGSQCVNCHMPQTTYMQRDPRHDHGFTIPDPLLTKDLDIPNACNRCHQDQDTEWSLAAVQKWYGEKMERPTRQRARWVAAARAGEPNAWTHLIRMADTEPQPFWQAVAAGLMRPYSAQPTVRASLLNKIGSEDPLVRGNAALALAPLVARGDGEVQSVLQQRLKDPVRKVRVDAAWALRATLEPESPAGTDLVHYLKHNADQPTGLLQYGVFHLDRGDTKSALDLLQQAVAWDPRSPGLRHEVAVVYSMNGQAAEAVAQLEKAVDLDPGEAEYHFKLGLAYNEIQDMARTTRALEQAVKLEPRHAQAWYNLGLAYSSSEQLAKSADALLRAETLNPGAPNIPYARATVLLRMNRMQEAAEAAQRALQMDPNHQGAMALLQQVMRQSRGQMPGF